MKTQAKWKGKGKATTSGGWRKTETTQADIATIPQGAQKAGPITRQVGLLFKVISIVVLFEGLD